jgi:hypothetical protein
MATVRKQLAAARRAVRAGAARQDMQVQLRLAVAADGVSAWQSRRWGQLKSLKANTVDWRLRHLRGVNGYTALFRGINVQIVNGTGETQINGMGN